MPKGEPMQRLQVLLPVHTIEWLKARADGRSASEAAREIICAEERSEKAEKKGD